MASSRARPSRCGACRSSPTPTTCERHRAASSWKSLWEAGASVRAYDPEAMEEAARIYPDQDGLELCESAFAALQGADALVIVTEWQEFRSPDFDQVKETLADPVIFDGRNLFDPGLLQTLGIRYYAIGRSNADADSAPAPGPAQDGHGRFFLRLI